MSHSPPKRRRECVGTHSVAADVPASTTPRHTTSENGEPMTRKLNQLRTSAIAALSAACLTLAACDDSPVEPEQAVPEVFVAVPEQAVAAAAAKDTATRGTRPDAPAVAIRDAIERVLPTFDPG